MAEPLLNLGDIGLVGEGVGGGGSAEGMHAQAVDLGADAGLQAVLAHNVAVERGGVKGTVEFFRGAVVADGAEEGPGRIAGVAGEGQVFLDEALGQGVCRHKPHLIPLAPDEEVHHALAALHILDEQAAQLLAAQAVIEQGDQDGPVAHALEGIFGGRGEQLAGLGIAQGGGSAFVAVGEWVF